MDKLGESGGEFVWLRAKTHSYLKINNDEDKKAKGTKKFVIETNLKFQDYENCLQAAQMKRVKGIMFLLKKLTRSL